jgi:hypothetical protein
VTGASLGLLAAIIGGGSTPLPDAVPSKFGLGLDWFCSDLFVMTVVFLPVERFWPLHPDQKTFRPQVDHGPVLLRGHAPARPADHAGDGQYQAAYASRWLAIPWLVSTVGSLPVSRPTAAGDCRRRSLAIRLSIAPFTASRSCGAFMRSITPLKRWIGSRVRARTNVDT